MVNLFPVSLHSPPPALQVFDAVRDRLQESNRKVNLYALESLQKMVRLLKDDMSGVLSHLVPAIVDNHLNSKNRTVYSAATGVLCEMVLHLGEGARCGELSGTWSSPTAALSLLLLTCSSLPLLQTAASSCSPSASRHSFSAAKQRWN